MADASWATIRKEAETVGRKLARKCGVEQRVDEELAAIAQRRREGTAFAILGDFNRRMERNDEFLAVLAEAAPLARPTEGILNTCGGRDGRARPFIDHILLGGPARDWLVRDSFRVLIYAERDASLRERLSDHCPISVRLDPR